jgi:hypothetical protein
VVLQQALPGVIRFDLRDEDENSLDLGVPDVPDDRVGQPAAIASGP